MATNISNITIDADRQRVWDVLTNPALVKRWQYGSDLQTTWEPGSAIRSVTKWEDKVFEQWGRVLEFTPWSGLRYSLFAPRPGLEDKPANYFEMIYSLADDNGKTRLRIVQEDNRPGAKQEKEQGEDNPVLKMLKEVAETK